MMRAAMRLSAQEAKAEDERNLRQALAASGQPPPRQQHGQQQHGQQQQYGRGGGGGADVDLQRALEASLRQPQQQQPQYRRR